ncbi:hypothetical protein HZS_5929 [Henneguya salminicola]|nr:hypothetical protein HZS_5929 [Henneguya salminicola]
MKMNIIIKIIVIFDLLLCGNSFRRKRTYQISRDSNQIEVYYYTENDDRYKEDLHNLLLVCLNCRIIVENKFVFTHHLLKIKKLKNIFHLNCITDQNFDQDSEQLCTFNQDFHIPKNAQRISFHLTPTHSTSVNLSFLHLKNNSTDDFKFLKRYFHFDIPENNSFIKIDMQGAILSKTLKYNIELFKSVNNNTFFPIVPKKYGNSSLNPTFCNTQPSTEYYECKIPQQYSIYLEYVNFYDFSNKIKIYDLSFSIVFLTSAILLLVIAIAFISSSYISNILHQSFYHIQISLFSSLLASVLGGNILLGSEFNYYMRQIMLFLTNYFWISTINSFTVSCINIIINCRHEMSLKNRCFKKKLIVQDVFSFLFGIISVVLCFIIHNHDEQYVPNNPYPVQPRNLHDLVFPIFLSTLICYTFMAGIAGLMVLTLVIQKVRIYKFSNYPISFDVSEYFYMLTYSFISVFSLSFSLFFYAISANSEWINNSQNYMFISVGLFVVYVVSLTFGFNRKLFIGMKEAAQHFFIPFYKPFSILKNKKTIQEHNYSILKDVQRTIEMERNKFSDTVPDTRTHLENTSNYYESFVDLVPVFQLSSIKSLHETEINNQEVTNQAIGGSILPDTNWKSSGISALAFLKSVLEKEQLQLSTTQCQSSCNNSTPTTLPHSFETMFSNNSISTSQYLTPDFKREYVYINPDSSEQHKQYRRTPFKVIPNNTNRSIGPVYKIEFDDSECTS